MHKGVFKGAHAAGDRNILVLGESHHHMVADDPDYTTEGVVKNYFKHPNDKCYRFFDKIVECFGFLPDEREQFWDRVWFGNYVEESNCGVGDSRARDLVEKHKERYNKDLFLFVNEHEIDIICCFREYLRGPSAFSNCRLRLSIVSRFSLIPGIVSMSSWVIGALLSSSATSLSEIRPYRPSSPFEREATVSSNDTCLLDTVTSLFLVTIGYSLFFSRPVCLESATNKR